MPIIFKPCDWKSTPLQQFRALPKDGKAITEFTNADVAFLDVVTSLRVLANQSRSIELKGIETPVEMRDGESSNTSRYRIRRQFDQLDKRDFVEKSFEEIYRFFEASASELSGVPGIECRLSGIDDGCFSCTIINRGIARGFETLHVRKGGSWGAIDILYGERNVRSTSNGGFSVVADDYQLYLASSMLHYGGREQEYLNPRQAAKMVWDDLLSKVGIDYASE